MNETLSRIVCLALHLCYRARGDKYCLAPDSDLMEIIDREWLNHCTGHGIAHESKLLRNRIRAKAELLRTDFRTGSPRQKVVAHSHMTKQSKAESTKRTENQVSFRRRDCLHAWLISVAPFLTSHCQFLYDLLWLKILSQFRLPACLPAGLPAQSVDDVCPSQAAIHSFREKFHTIFSLRVLLP